jgi:uncharacterized protein YbjT (DUF2867 family)
MTTRSVCVVGGTGFIGQHVVHLLCQRGIQVVVPTRRRDNGRELFLLPTVEVVEADLADPQQLAHLVDGHDAVINLVGILKERRRGDFYRVHEDLPHRIVEACRSQKVSRLIHVSSLGAAHDHASQYQRSKAAGEAQLRLAMSAGIRTTVLRPSVVFGDNDNFLSPLVRLLRVAPMVLLPCGNARVQPIYVEDVARVCVAALDLPDSYGETLPLCGPRVYTLAELVRFLAIALRLDRRIVPLNASMSVALAALTEWLPGTPLTRDMVLSLHTDNVCDAVFPEFVAAPTTLEAFATAWLNSADTRHGYDRFRAHH